MARSVWSASSLLPLSNVARRSCTPDLLGIQWRSRAAASCSHSKRFARFGCWKSMHGLQITNLRYSRLQICATPTGSYESTAGQRTSSVAAAVGHWGGGGDGAIVQSLRQALRPLRISGDVHLFHLRLLDRGGAFRHGVSTT